MRAPSVEAEIVESAVATALADCPRVVLAVSGGLDSMVLLHAAVNALPHAIGNMAVATFNHGTGKFAERAVALVSKTSHALGVHCVAGRADTAGTRENEWRRARWNFLRGVAFSRDAFVATAHTRDDQIETVFIRILRDAGPRGLAGLYAESDVVRPFLTVDRRTLAAYARAKGVNYIEDPSNLDRKHLRNRVRHDLLPSIVKQRPQFTDELLELARESAEWRREMEDIANTVESETELNGALRINRSTLSGFDTSALRVLWPVVAARASVVMDRRGTQRAAEFTIKGSTGGTIQLSGGVEIVMRRDYLLLQRWRSAEELRA